MKSRSRLPAIGHLGDHLAADNGPSRAGKRFSVGRVGANKSCTFLSPL
jgi:hypothetical protein